MNACRDCQSAHISGLAFCANHDPATPGSVPFVDTTPTPPDDTVKAVEDFLLGAFVPATTAAADANVSMRRFGQQVGNFILGVLDTGCGVHVALQEAAILVSAIITNARRPE